MAAGSIGLRVQIAQGEGWAPLQRGFHGGRHAVGASCADGEIQGRHAAEDLVAQALCHASHQADDAVGALTLCRAQQPKFSEGFVFGLSPHGAGIDDHDIGTRLIGRRRMAGVKQRFGRGLAFADVHLATVGMEGKRGHRKFSFAGFRVIISNPHFSLLGRNALGRANA